PQRREPSYAEYVPARHFHGVVTLPATLAVKAIPLVGNQSPVVVALWPKPTAPNGRGAPPAGAKRWIQSEIQVRREGTSDHSPCSGADDAMAVRIRAAKTAAVTKVTPPWRYSADTADGSPIRRRIQVTCSSNVCARTSRISAATLKTTR